MSGHKSPPRVEMVPPSTRFGGWGLVHYFEDCWIGHEYEREGVPVRYITEKRARRAAERWIRKEKARAARPKRDRIEVV